MPDSEILAWLSAHLVRMGPGLLFVVCLLETAIFVGLVLPVGALIATASMLASRGLFEPGEVIAAAFFGALIGDQLGFAVGRWFVSGAKPRGSIARVWTGAVARTQALVRDRGSIGITLARTTPFVRTIMPWFAGRSGLRWGRFFFFDLLGVILWGLVYIGGGFLAGAGWSRVAGQYGELVGAIAVTILVTGVLVLSRGWFVRLFQRRRHRL